MSLKLKEFKELADVLMTVCAERKINRIRKHPSKKNLLIGTRSNMEIGNLLIIMTSQKILSQKTSCSYTPS